MARFRRLSALALCLSLLCGPLSPPLRAQTAALMPDAFPQFFDSNGDPLSGGTLTFYMAGTTTPLTAYSDVTRGTPLANPLTLDSAGRPTTNIYLGAASYKVVLKDADGITLKTADHVTDVALVAGLAVAPLFIQSSATGTVNDLDLTDGVTAGTVGSSLGTKATYATVFLRINNASTLTITGFSFGVNGQRLIVMAVGSAAVNIVSQSASSFPVNRSIAMQSTTPLAPGDGIAELVYDSSSQRWRMVSAHSGQFALYTTLWTGSGGNPAIGNGTIQARYSVVGHIVYVDLVLFMGSTTTYGSGQWTWTLPMPALDANGQVGGNAMLLDGSGPTYHNGTPFLVNTTQFVILAPAASSLLSSTTPFTWANTDVIRASFWYIAA